LIYTGRKEKITMNSNSRPRILIIMPDQLRADAMSCAGHPIVRTPNIDRIAAEGVRFSNTYSTCPICMPVRSSVLSGVYSHNHGQWHNYGELAGDADTYLRHLKNVGYRTCQVGKSHLYEHGKWPHLNDRLDFMHALGWDDVLETTGPWATTNTDSIMTDHWKEVGCLDTFRDDYKKRGETHGPGGREATWPSPMPEDEHMDAFVGRTAVEYVEGREDDGPLCLFVGFGGPHEPWDPPAPWAAQYDPADMGAAKPLDAPGDWVGEAGRDYQANFSIRPNMTKEMIAEIRARYYAKISHIDHWVGRILDTYEKRGWLENTCVIFWSDHGEMLGDKSRLFKQVFYEGSVSVPLIVRKPGKADAGAVCEGLTSLVDIFPTVLEAAGCEPKKGAFGRSLIPYGSDPAGEIHDAVFSEINEHTMIRDSRYKMAVNRTGDTIMLYDMIEDPDERANLAGKPDMTGVEARLRERLLRFLLETRTDQDA